VTPLSSIVGRVGDRNPNNGKLSLIAESESEPDDSGTQFPQYLSILLEAAASDL